MSYSTLITGPERRRRWSEEQKLELLAEAFGPGGNVTETARRADIHTSLLYRWRRAALTPPPPSGFTPAVLIAAPDEPPQRSAGPAILVELPGGARVHVAASAPADLVTATGRRPRGGVPVVACAMRATRAAPDACVRDERGVRSCAWRTLRNCNALP